MGGYPPGSSPPCLLVATQTRVTSQRPMQLEWRLGQGHGRRWFITVIECLQPCYSVSRAEEKGGPLNSLPGKVSPFPFLLKPSNTLWEGCISDSKAACATPTLGGSGADRWFSPLNLGPQERRVSPQSCSSSTFTGPLVSILKLQGQGKARPPGRYQTRLPLLEQARLPLPPAKTANRDPGHTRAKVASIVIQSQPALLPSHWPLSEAPQPGTQVQCGMVEAGSSQQSCDQQSFKWGM